MTDQTSGEAAAAVETRKPQATMVAQTKVETVPLTPLEVLTDLINDTFEKYSKEMAINTSVNIETGLRNQQRLWRLLQKVMAVEGADFHTAWDLMLSHVKKGRVTYFSERYAYRFLDKMTNVPKDGRILFERLLNLMMLTCDPATRGQIMSRYDWRHLRRSLEAGTVGEKLTEYYGI